MEAGAGAAVRQWGRKEEEKKGAAGEKERYDNGHEGKNELRVWILIHSFTSTVAACFALSTQRSVFEYDG